MKKVNIEELIRKKFDSDIHEKIIFSVEGLALLCESINHNVLKPLIFYKGVPIGISYTQKRLIKCLKKKVRLQK